MARGVTARRGRAGANAGPGMMRGEHRVFRGEHRFQQIWAPTGFWERVGSTQRRRRHASAPQAAVNACGCEDATRRYPRTLGAGAVTENGASGNDGRGCRATNFRVWKKWVPSQRIAFFCADLGGGMARRAVWPIYISPRHTTHREPSFLELMTHYDVAINICLALSSRTASTRRRPGSCVSYQTV